jgi:lactoylglutathione lyase
VRYLHTMVRVADLDRSVDFYCNKLGMIEVRRIDRPEHKYSLVFLAAPEDEAQARTGLAPTLELTYNYDPEAYGEGRNFGHMAFEVEDIYRLCQSLMDAGITINRPPRDGHMAFIRSPDDISIELLQKGDALGIREPWASMANSGHW